ncbi:hypothetical protein H0H92_015450 [Tricholoma furcatifolium]|nr:hypothetical protein H0H92_015450 [Tricholoma furcatifolium]
MLSVIFLLASLIVLNGVLGAVYNLADSHQGSGFLKAFSYQAIPDPTNGRVNYVDAATAASENLTFSSGNTFILRADYTQVLSASGPGRDSVRLQSNEQYTTSVTIFNVRHMPQGCGTWPSLWTVGADWPDEGEIDILEGVNDQGPNQSTLHTSSGCTMPSTRDESGVPVENNCDAEVNNNAGCGVKFSDSRSFGPTFNDNGGGCRVSDMATFGRFAMERTTTEVKVWFWSKTATNVPSDVANGDSSIDTDAWSTPAAYFPDTSCPIGSKFGPHNIIINLTFCGDYAGNPTIYAESGCPSTCDAHEVPDYVDNNPSAFVDAYFDLEWLKIYE